MKEWRLPGPHLHIHCVVFRSPSIHFLSVVWETKNARNTQQCQKITILMSLFWKLVSLMRSVAGLPNNKIIQMVVSQCSFSCNFQIRGAEIMTTVNICVIYVWRYDFSAQFPV